MAQRKGPDPGDPTPEDPTRSGENFELPVWLQPDGVPVSCIEKIKVLNENLEELREMAQDALEDGILMGCDEGQIRDVLMLLVRSLENPYAKSEAKAENDED